MAEMPELPAAARGPSTDAPSVFAPALALPQQQDTITMRNNKSSGSPTIDAYLVLQCSRVHDIVLLLFELMQRIATNQLVRSRHSHSRAHTLGLFAAAAA